MTTPSTPPPATSRRRGSRGPTTVYTTAAVVLLVLIATLAITTESASPPSIAEYAPHSIQQIKHAPPNQAGNFGDVGGAPAAGGKTAGPSPSPSPSLTPPVGTSPRTLTCVGEPPRQTADPQSPPCVSSWVGNNGGSTSKGVTSTEVRVYMPPLFNNNEYFRVVADLQKYFNNHFEFYGRQLNLSPQQTSGGAEPSANGTCSDIQAQADWVSKELNVFAAADNGSDSCWYDEIGRNKVISLSGQTTENRFEQQKLAPYLYSYPGDGEDLLGATGEFICKQLAGKDATHSSDAVYSRSKRVFGLIVSATLSEIPTPQATINDQLRKCGEKFAKTVVIQAGSSDDQSQNQQDNAQWAAAAQNAVVAMHQAQVSTVVCVCQILATAAISSSANSQNYFPEWITERSDQNVLTQGWAASERPSMMMVSSFPKQIRESQSFFIQALQEVDPGFCPCASSLDFLYGQLTYWQLLMLASGVQMAGPDLTPYSFQRGLQSTVFPNPPDPLDEGHVSFAGGRHTMIDDYLVAWWNSAQSPPYQGDPQGSWCYAEGGRRFALGAFPARQLLPANFATATCIT
jgi:hypothetical protein